MKVGSKLRIEYDGSWIGQEQMIVALEKQIPRKVVQPFGTGEGCYCPSCKKGIDKDYCGYCGQKLDWD